MLGVTVIKLKDRHEKSVEHQIIGSATPGSTLVPDKSRTGVVEPPHKEKKISAPSVIWLRFSFRWTRGWRTPDPSNPADRGAVPTMPMM
jgi:hypothetical protein